MHGGKFVRCNFPVYFFFYVHNCCHVRIKEEGVFLTLLLLITGSTRDHTQMYCWHDATPQKSLPDWTILLLPSEAFFSVNSFRLNIFDFSSLAAASTLDPINNNYNFFLISLFSFGFSFFVTDLCCFSSSFFRLFHFLPRLDLALTLSLTAFNPKKV